MSAECSGVEEIFYTRAIEVGAPDSISDGVRPVHLAPGHIQSDAEWKPQEVLEGEEGFDIGAVEVGTLDFIILHRGRVTCAGVCPVDLSHSLRHCFTEAPGEYQKVAKSDLAVAIQIESGLIPFIVLTSTELSGKEQEVGKIDLATRIKVRITRL